MPIKEMRVGRKKFYVCIDGEDSYAAIDCDEFCDVGFVKVKLTTEQAARLVNRSETREHIQVILPDVPKELREMFVSGTTPAEWDATMRGKRRHWRYYQKEMGYVFTPEDMGCTEQELDKNDDEKRYKR